MTDKLTLTRSEAAALCGLTPAGFDVWVRKGIVPPAIYGTRRWSRAALERAISGESATIDLDPYERWKIEHERHQRFVGKRLPDSTPDRPAKPLGRRERAVLLALKAAGGSVPSFGRLPAGPVTIYKLAARGYFVARGKGTFDAKLSAAGELAAELIESM